MASVLKSRGSSDLDVEALLPVARDILAGGPLAFDELRPRLQERFPGADDRSLGYAVRMALPLVMEPSDDAWGYPRSAAFGLSEGKPRPKGAAELARRYLAAFGPASPADFQTWSGLPRSVLEALRPELRAFRDESGRELLDLPDAPRPDEDVPAPVRLLPDFDNLVLAYADRTRVIADAHRPLVATKNLRIKATFLVDGEVAGTWSVKGRRVELEPFGRLTRAVRTELDEEAERLAEFLRS
jgi:hypothetical protein